MPWFFCKFLDVISKKSRYKFKTYAKKIDSSVNIYHKVYYGHIDDETYEFVFDYFRTLLRKRFFCSSFPFVILKNLNNILSLLGPDGKIMLLLFSQAADTYLDIKGLLGQNKSQKHV